MFKRQNSSCISSCLSSPVVVSKRSYWLYASMNASRNMDRRSKHQGAAFVPSATVQAMLSRTSNSSSVVASSAPAEKISEEVSANAVDWEDKKSSADIIRLEEEAQNISPTISSTKSLSSDVRLPAIGRPFMPLAECAKMELSGDYCFEGGLYQDSLERYGVVAKAFKSAFPALHNKQAGIALKLSRAFRATGDVASAKYNAERALDILSKVENAQVELIAESFLELGRAAAVGNGKEKEAAGLHFEDCLTVLNEFHDMGLSSRMLKHHHFASSHNHKGLEQKFHWFSPYDFDRVFTLVDAALEEAETFYRAASDQAGVVRVLEAKTQLVDTKFFNMRNDSGKITRNHAQWRVRSNNWGETPSATDILTYTPTVHQIYRDYSLENTAPLDLHSDRTDPDERVQQGGNRKVMDDGDPLRFRMKELKEQARRHSRKPIYDEKELLRW